MMYDELLKLFEKNSKKQKNKCVAYELSAIRIPIEDLQTIYRMVSQGIRVL